MAHRRSLLLLLFLWGAALLSLSLLLLLPGGAHAGSFADEDDEDEPPIFYNEAGEPVRGERQRTVKTTVHTTNPDLGKKAQRVDLPYIACEVCELTLANIWNQSLALKEREGNGREFKMKLNKATKKICDHGAFEGRWIQNYDIQEKERVGGVVLRLVRQEEGGMCEIECDTIAKSCLQLFKKEGVDREEVLEDLLENAMTLPQLQQKYCTDISSRCSKNTRNAVMKKGERKDHKFKVKTKEAKTYDRIMDAFAEHGVIGNDDGTAAPDIVERFDNVLKMLEERGEL